MFSLSLRCQGCTVTATLNGITVVEPDPRPSRSLSMGCAESILTGLNRMELAISRIGETRKSGGVGSVELELDRIRRTKGGVESTSMVRLRREVGDGEVSVIQQTFEVSDAPALELWRAEAVGQFSEFDADRSYELAIRMARALEQGDHPAAAEDARVKFHDIARSVDVEVGRMVQIYAQGLQELGRIVAIPFTRKDLRVVAEADNRLFMLKRSGGAPLVSFQAGDKRLHVPIGVSRIGGVWRVSR